MSSEEGPLRESTPIDKEKDMDKDSAIDLSKEIEEIGKLQWTLDRMLECDTSPSTSSACDSKSPKSKTSTPTRALTASDKPHGLSARKLVRVPCAASPSDASPLPFTVYGGAAEAKLILIDIVRRFDLVGILNPNDILLTVEDVNVSGMTRGEVMQMLEKLFFDKEQIAVEVLPADAITTDICEILTVKNLGGLQTIIRDNLYSKTVPYTTRPARPGEVDGEHYRFVSVTEFNRLQQCGLLLEHGTYQGHLYGTPRPEEVNENGMVSAPTRGPLPPNWEIGYTENGEKYYIDHNTGSTTWDDPRLLPDGWEQVDDPVYGTFYVDHINKKTQYERPGGGVQINGNGAGLYEPLPILPSASYSHEDKLKSARHHASRTSLNSRQPPQDATTNRRPISTNGNFFFTRDPQQLRGDMVSTTIIKGPKGLGFTLIGNDASSNGDEFIQVKSVLSGGPAADNGVLQAGDILVRVNGTLLLGASQSEACRIFLNIPVGDPVAIQVCRGYPLMLDPSNRIITENVYVTGGKTAELEQIEITKGAEGFGFTIADNITGQRVKKILYPSQCPNLLEGDTIVELDGRNVRSIAHTQLVDMLRELPIGYRGKILVKRSSPKHHRSRTPTAAFRYGEQRGTPTPVVNNTRSKTPAPNSRQSSEHLNGYGTTGRNSTLHRQSAVVDGTDAGMGRMRPSSSTLGFATPNYMPISAFHNEQTSDLITVNLIRKPSGFGFRLLGGNETNTVLHVGQIVAGGAAAEDRRMKEGDEILEIDGCSVHGASHAEAVALLEKAAQNKHVKMILKRSKIEQQKSEYDVILTRTDTDGFGFIIISSLNRMGSTIGQILNDSPAARCGLLKVGDRVVAVNGTDILDLSHGEIVGLIKASGLTVRLTIAGSSAVNGTPLATSTLTRQTNGHSPSVRSQYSNYERVPQQPNYAPYAKEEITSRKFSNGELHSGYSSYAEIQRPMISQLSLQEHGGVYQDPSVINVELERGVQGFGFSIRGGQEFGAMPLFVLRIAEDGPAAHDGRLKVGDQLISINGRDTKGLTHEEAIQLIKQRPLVRLVVRRPRLP